MATIASSRPSAPMHLSSAKGDAAATSSATTSATPASHQYTCNTCQVAFRFADTQKSHMKSDWHRYNLQRRVASLPPISSEVFTDKVQQAKAATTAEANRAGFQRECVICQKTYFSQNSYQNHLASQKHKAKEIAARHQRKDADETSSTMSSTFSLGEPLPKEVEMEDDSETDAEFGHIVQGLKDTDINTITSPIKRPPYPSPDNVSFDRTRQERDSKENVAMSDVSNDATSTKSAATPAPNLTLKSCLFCNYDSPTVQLSTIHMERIHGMFIPEKKYLVDLDGLVSALQQRIQELNECLYCGKMKYNGFAIQTHMRDKGHCKIPYTTEAEQLEIGEFYDFRSTYSDDGNDEDEDVDDKLSSGGAKLGAKRMIKRVAVAENGDQTMTEGDTNDQGWETDSSASSINSEELGSVPIDCHQHLYERLDKHPHHSSHDPRHHHQLDGWHSHAHKHRAVFHDDTTLYLPSGRAVGHRSLARYYRQNLHSHPSPEERAERLAIEAADKYDSTDAMEIDDEQKEMMIRREHMPLSRAHGGLGMLGVTVDKKKEVKRAELRAKKREHNAQKRQQWAVNKQANHQKHYNPQLL